LDSDGSAFVTFQIAEDLTFEGSETTTFTAVEGPGVSASAVVVINDTSIPTTASLQVQVQPAAVNEGQFLTFSITSENLAAGTSVAWNAGILSPQDVVGGVVAGTVVLNAEGEATVVLVTSEDASVSEGDETFVFTATAGGSGLAATASATIFDSSVAPVQAVLTENTDIVENALVTGFTIFGNEQTLGQNDQISSAPTGATLNIGTEFDFAIGNFTTDNIETFLFSPSEALGERGEIDMRNAVGVENLNVNRSNLDTFQFDDLQSAVNLTANLDDSFTDFEFNFDSTALTGDDSLDVVFSEAPIDAASGESLGIVATQGPNHAAASIETLNLTSVGVSDANILGALSVGPDLEELNIDGSVDLNVLQDIGLSQSTDLRAADEAGNSDVSIIDARGLVGDLFGGVSAYNTAPTGNSYFTYTSEVAGDVSVLGATGDNYFQLVSGQTRAGTTSFIVRTFDGDDDILTDIGNDDVNAGNGDNTVFTFEGNDEVVTLEGADVIDTGIGADFVSSGGGNDDIDAGDGNDTVVAGNGNNTVVADGGDNVISSLEGNDVISTTDGDDFVDSGFGNDTVITELGSDTVVSSGGDNFIVTSLFDTDLTNDSTDSVVTGAGSDTIYTGGGNDVVDSGAGDDLVIDGAVVSAPDILLDDDGNTFNLGLGNDYLYLNLENLQLNDVIDGGLGIDTVTLSQGGVLRQSETLLTSNVEAFNLVNDGNFEVTLSEDLIETSDDIDIAGNQRIFSVYTGDSFSGSSAIDTAGDVTLDLTNLSPISEGLANVPLINSVRYFGQDDNNSERVIVTDRMMSSYTHLRFGEIGLETANDPDSDVNYDVLVVQDEIELSNSDLSNVDGLEVIDLTATTNGNIDFVLDFSSMTIDDFRRLVGDFYINEGNTTNDELLIRATESLNVASASFLDLILPIDDAAAEYIGARISIEESAELNVEVFNEVVGFEVDISTALFFTPNADDLSPTDGQTVVAYELNDLQPADKVQGTATGIETIDFRFGLANDLRTMQEQLNNIFTDDVDVFDFNPGAVNQAVRFEGLFGDNLGSGEIQTIFGLDSVFTSGGDDRMVEIEAVQFDQADTGTNTVTEISTLLFVDSAEGDDTVTTESDTTTSTGADARITVTAGEGDDSVVGFNGFNSADSLLGQLGNDTIFGRDGADQIFGDGLAGSPVDGDDSLSGGDGNDFIFGGNGDNTVSGGNDFDSIVTGFGADSIRGGQDDDTITSGAGDDTVLGDSGADSILGGDGFDSILGGTESDVIFGGADADIIWGDTQGPSTPLDGNDVISGGTGNDFIFTGFGEDNAMGDEDNDVIVFGNDFFLETFNNDDLGIVTQESEMALDTTGIPADEFLNDTDTVDGGTGIDDVLSFAIGNDFSNEEVTLADDELIPTGSTQVSGIETINVLVSAEDDIFASVLLDNSILKQVASNSVQVNVAGFDQSDSGGLIFDSTSFVQGESVVFYDSSTNSDGTQVNSRDFGAGDDTYANNDDTAENTFSDEVTISGNGGADSIYLSASSGSNEFVKYNTGNDGGNPGDSAGGDTVYNFSGDDEFSDDDKVLIGNDGDLATGTGTSIVTVGTKATGLLFDLTERYGTFVQEAELIAIENEELILGGQTAQQNNDFLNITARNSALEGGAYNMLFLTKPARSLTDAQLTDASAIVDAINNVGVRGNDYERGDGIVYDGEDFTVQQQSNQALIVQQGQFNTALWLYVESSFDFGDDQAYTVEASELSQLAIFEGALLTQEDFLTSSGAAVIDVNDV
jgi:Ca2+-binding RTX toxin-like protein